MAKPEQIRAQFAADISVLPHLTATSLFRRQEQQNDPVRTGILIEVGIALLVFLASMIAVLTLHATAL
jgi:hypothetical protein